jgi:predicted RecB family endonuclease
MTSRQKTSAELAEMIATWLHVAGVRVAVHPDRVYGWHPMVIAAPSATDKYQQLAEEVASELRLAYELNV